LKKKKLTAIGLIFIGLIGLALAIAPAIGLMAITSAAFEDYPTEFDPTSASLECTGNSPEFELTSKEFTINQTGSIFFESQTPRTICGINQQNAIYSQPTNTLKFLDYEANKKLVGYPQNETINKQTQNVIGFVAQKNAVTGNDCWLAYSNGEAITEKGTITKTYSKTYESQASTIHTESWCPNPYKTTNETKFITDFWGVCRCRSQTRTDSTWAECNQTCVNWGGYMTDWGGGQWCEKTVGEPAQNESVEVMECVFAEQTTIPSTTNPIIAMPNNIKQSGVYEWLLSSATTNQKTITFTVPKQTVPETLHYREYSCPLESGHYLTAQTFVEHDQIHAGSFAYEPNYFCSRHGIIQTQLATQRSIETTEEYKQIIAGQTLTVPAGDTWTFFYVPKTNVELPVKCEEGDYYDVETEKCVKLVSGFVYVCVDPETSLVGNQCVKEADLKIICPIDSELIDGKCYLAGETIITCPPGYTKAGNKCYLQGSTVTTCPDGYELRDNACYIEGKNIIECPDGYDLLNSQCIQRGELITTCPTGYTLKDGACYTIGTQNMVCPDGTHKTTIDNEERCIIDSTYCPDGYTRQNDKCVKPGETICPSGTIKIGDKCQRTETVCPEGSIEINNACVRQGEIVCPEGTTMNEKKQCVQPPIELPNINYLSAGIGTITLITGALLLRF